MRAVGFSEPVNVRDLDPDFLSSANHGGRRGRSRSHHPQPGLEANAASRAVFGQSSHDNRGSAEMSDAFLLDQVDRMLSVDLRQANVPRPNRRYCPGEAPAVAMEHGQRPQIYGARRKSVLDNLADSVYVTAAMCVHHAFRRAGSATGVVDRDDIILSYVVWRHSGAAFVQKRFIVGNDALELGHLAGNREQ